MLIVLVSGAVPVSVGSTTLVTLSVKVAASAATPESLPLAKARPVTAGAVCTTNCAENEPLPGVPLPEGRTMVSVPVSVVVTRPSSALPASLSNLSEISSV